MKKINVIAACALFLIGAISCTNSEKNTEAEASEVVEFYASQPVESGLYAATYYAIVENGDTTKQGKFDGRVLVALEPSNSGLYVYENGNRTKIDYRLVLKQDFNETGDDVYTAVAQGGEKLIWSEKGEESSLSIETPEKTVNFKIEKNPLAKTTASEAWNRISNELKKNK